VPFGRSVAQSEAPPSGFAAPPAATPPPPRRRRSPLRRFALVAGMVVGVALITDGLLTIFWQEPLTAVQQAHSQSVLRSDLPRLQQILDQEVPASSRLTKTTRVYRQAIRLLHDRPSGSAIGQIDIPKIGLKTVMVQDTDHDALAKGPGHYKGTVLPGIDGTVGIAGHRTTYGAPFRHVDELRDGSEIRLTMPYGKFTYRVTKKQIVSPANATSLISHAGQRKLVLTACNPLYSAAQRLVISARLVSETPA
jgi:sortase A